jgi:hypothetical protein
MAQICLKKSEGQKLILYIGENRGGSVEIPFDVQR